MSIQGLAPRAHPALAPLCKPDIRDTVLGRLCEVAHALPQDTALVDESGSITFDELIHRIYAAARRIAAVAPGAGTPIAVTSPSTVDAVTLMLAVIASGRPLVPLDPHLPAARRARIVEKAGAHLLDADALADSEYSAVPLPTATGEHIAVIAFTSGSTGAAKGVLLSNRMCLTKAYEVSSTLGLSPRHRVGNALPVSFGAGLNTVLAGILSGAQVHCRDPRAAHTAPLTQWITHHSLTTLHCSPSLVRAMSGVTTPGPVHAVPDNRIPSLQYVVTYGEALHGRDVTSFRSGTGCGATFVNWYATTEAGAVARHKYRAEDSVPAGFLAAGSCPSGKFVDIVHADGTLARPGEVGQIRLTGDCFADGYLDLPAQTDARFTTDSGRRRYWTGDLGRIGDDGLLQLVGRVDDAVKIRGYLVEPAEVEGALRAVTGVTDAAVVKHETDSVVELAAYFVADSVTEDEIRAALRKMLPDWMVPKFVTAIDVIPRTERGKLDRSALFDESARTDSSAGESTLDGATEYWLAHIVSRELELDSMHRDADFAELGATSLVTTRILVEIQLAFHVDLTPADLVSAMSVRKLAALIDDRHASADRARSGRARSGRARSGTAEAGSNNSILVPLRSEGSRTPLFVVAGAGVPAVGLAPLANRLTDRPVYALQARGLDSRALPHRTLRGAARAYVREIRRVQPQGPYALAGHSLGAWIALEMAHILRAEGHVVERIVLLDPRLYRWLLNRLPGGERLEDAPPEPGNPMYRPSLSVIVRQAVKVATAGLVRFRTTERWLAFGIIGAMALRWHRPTPWDGPATVFVTESNTPDRDSWAAVATGDLHITQLPGHHIGLVREPVVATVASVIDRALDLDRLLDADRALDSHL